MNDGLILKADVCRPETSNKVPVILAVGAYGKGVKYQEHYSLWDSLVEMHPDVLKNSQKYLTWETVDPEKSGFHGDAVLDLTQRRWTKSGIFGHILTEGDRGFCKNN